MFAIIILTPIFVLVPIIIKIDSKGPVLFKHRRLGKNLKPLFIYKFRKMVKDAHLRQAELQKINEMIGGQLFKCDNDPRLTKVGKFLRKCSFDELPQLFNILKGEMSIVGPRPHSTPLNYQSRNEVKHYMMRHMFKSGLTGWSQVDGFRGATNNCKLMQKRVEHDLWYIENWSIWLDIQIILLTLRRMLQGDPNAY